MGYTQPDTAPVGSLQSIPLVSIYVKPVKMLTLPLMLEMSTILPFACFLINGFATSLAQKKDP